MKKTKNFNQFGINRRKQLHCSAKDEFLKKELREKEKCWLPAISPFPIVFLKFLLFIRSMDGVVTGKVLQKSVSTVYLPYISHTMMNSHNVVALYGQF